MKPLDQSGRPNPVHCAACLNTTGAKTVAAWITDSRYLLCDQHKGIDMAELIKTVWSRQRYV